MSPSEEGLVFHLVTWVGGRHSLEKRKARGSAKAGITGLPKGPADGTAATSVSLESSDISEWDQTRAKCYFLHKEGQHKGMGLRSSCILMNLQS